MQHYKTAYELEGLDPLDIQIVLDTDYNQVETDIRWDGKEEDGKDETVDSDGERDERQDLT